MPRFQTVKLGYSRVSLLLARLQSTADKSVQKNAARLNMDVGSLTGHKKLPLKTPNGDLVE